MIRHFGVLIPSTNTTVEMEYNRLLPPTLQVHVGRLGKGDNTPFAPSRPDDIAYQARLLGTAQVEIVCLVQTSASLSADEYDATTTRQMTAGAGVPSLTSAQAIGHAVRALGARRIALVSPYSQEILGRARQYFESRYGLEVVAMEGFGATDSYAISTISADHATAAFTRVDRPEIEALPGLPRNCSRVRRLRESPRVFGPAYSRRLSPGGSSSARPAPGTVVHSRPCPVARRWCRA